MTARGAVVVAVLLTAAAGGAFLAQQVLGPAAPPAVSARTDGPVEGAARPPFALPDLEGRVRSVAEWDGRVLVVNFWATWCPPCRKEMPAFIELQEQLGGRGLQFVGVAIDDLDRVRDFAQRIGVNYPVLVGDADAADVSTAYGNTLGALPYTAVVDRSGRIAYARPGAFSREAVLEAVEPLL